MVARRTAARYPDIDILIVSQKTLPPALGEVSQFITLLWDLRLEVGYAVMLPLLVLLRLVVTI